jgi:hypothetical protein
LFRDRKRRDSIVDVCIEATLTQLRVGLGLLSFEGLPPCCVDCLYNAVALWKCRLFLRNWPEPSGCGDKNLHPSLIEYVSNHHRHFLSFLKLIYVFVSASASVVKPALLSYPFTRSSLLSSS